MELKLKVREGSVRNILALTLHPSLARVLVRALD